MSVKTGLGRGLGSLIPQDFDTSALIEVGERIEHVAVTKLEPNPDQPRTIFDEAALQELADSIMRHGIMQPLVVSPHGGGYIIIAGERRWRAAQLAKLKTVPVVVRTIKQLERLELALVENVQRVDLSPLEQAVSIARLHEQFNLSYGAISKRLGKAETTLSNVVRLLQLPNKARDALANGAITEGHARQILAIKGMPDKQAELLSLITTQAWNVRQAERYVTSLKEGFRSKTAATARVALETPETQRLSKRYSTSVKIHRMAKGGRLEITFHSDDDLQRLLTELER
jgi:ParB family chromosome partitioning protein